MNAPLGNAASLAPFLPELVLSAGIVVVLLVGLADRPGRERAFVALTVLALAAVAASAIYTGAEDRALFGGLLARDAFADYFKVLFAAAGIIVALCGYRSSDVGDASVAAAAPAGGGTRGEWFALLLSLVLGANLMAAATDLLTAYVALEFVSILSYLLTGLSRHGRRASEAALKYAIYGGVATGALLYGFSLLFGLSLSTDLAAIRVAVASAPPLTIAVTGTLCLAGFAFKMAVVPFHMWCPDAYQGAPTPIAALFSVVPKAAGFALAYRFLVGGSHAGGHVAGVAGWLGDVGPAGTWTLVLAALAAATMTVGNLAALVQTDVKRLLAYSSIAHAGTILMALAVGSDQACEAMLLYLGVYLFMNLAAFLVVIAVTERGVGESLDDLKGLGRRTPVAAFCLIVALFSLTGLPPTAGFVAKYAIFAVVIRRGIDGGGSPLFILALVGVLNTVVSLVYYAKIIRLVTFEPPTEHSTTPLRLSSLHTGLLAATTLPVIALGIYAAPLTDLARRSVGFWTLRR